MHWISGTLTKPDHAITYHKQMTSQCPSQTGPHHHAEEEENDFCRCEVCMVQQGLYGQTDATVLTVSIGIQYNTGGCRQELHVPRHGLLRWHTCHGLEHTLRLLEVKCGVGC